MNLFDGMDKDDLKTYYKKKWKAWLAVSILLLRMCLDA